MLSFFNTLSRSKEPFEPIAPQKAGVYSCGPTVYDYAHIGNLRALVFADILRRVLARAGYDVTQVMNITDVGHLTSDADTGDDKMMKGLAREGLPVSLDGMRELADRYTRAFMEDMEELNVQTPSVMPRASEHIAEQIELIGRLEAKGLTYVTSDGVYFLTSEYPEYGKLGGLSEPSAEHARVADNGEKRDSRDFALWKFSAKGGSASGGSELGWESPWGKGFPGWHIECSAMSMKYLGESFDIHTGGIEHIAVHHNNEIAQSEGATEKPLARFWLHNDHVLVGGRKMAKSEGTGYTRGDLEARGIAPLAYRYWVLTAHYRSSANFTWDAARGAQAAYDRLRERVGELPDGGTIERAYDTRFLEAIGDDLDTPQTLALTWDLLKDTAVSDADKKATILSWDEVLGLRLGDSKEVLIPDDVQELVEKREKARRASDWSAADTLRKEIETHGFIVKDTPEGPKLYHK